MIMLRKYVNSQGTCTPSRQRMGNVSQYTCQSFLLHILFHEDLKSEVIKNIRVDG